MDKWKYYQLDEICRVIAGGTPRTKRKEYWNGDIPWITPKDLSIYKSKYICCGERSITKEGLDNSSAKLTPSKSVILSTRAPIGYIAITTQNVTTNQGMKALVPREKTTSEFLYYLIKYNIPKMLNIASGSTFKEISTTDVKKLKVKIPPINTQKAIANILSSLDDKIVLNNKINSKLEALAQILYKRWFVDFEFPNENGEPYKSSGGEMVDSELGLIPKGWEIKTIDEIAKTFLGGTPSRKNDSYWNGNIPWINSSRINDFRIIDPTEYITFEGLKNSSAKLMTKNTTVIAITGATLGQVSILSNEFCANQSVVGISSKDENHYSFIYEMIKNDIKNIIANQTGGAQQHINKDNVNSHKIVYPAKDMIDRFSSIVNSLFDNINNLAYQNKKLSNMRDILLPKLMSGEIEVPTEE